ncbi:fas-activated serine/threonine kinase [Manacus vitellinus]|uniref:fas-activated serine/threonine kinase n=1 Tax=Manacus vitellinus TaxID=328815 RepID=UPI00115DD876|nr:fas-activated serine/threonine kinase [Manacus vitellinus]
MKLEFREYSGPRLDPRYRVLMFEHALTADEANRKYSYKGLVAEALRQLVGEECYRQDEVLPPGYCTDFLLWINRSGTVLPLSRVPAASKAPPATSPAAMSLRSSVLALTSDLQDFAPFAPETPSSPPGPRESGRAGRFLPALCPALGGPCFQPPSDYYCGLSKEPSLGSPGSSTLSSPSECLSAPPPGTPDCSPRLRRLLFPRLPHPRQIWTGTTAAHAAVPARATAGFARGAAQDAPPRRRTSPPRVVLSVNDKWHYCQNSDILVGSRAMRDRHLRLLGYCLVQVNTPSSHLYFKGLQPSEPS